MLNKDYAKKQLIPHATEKIKTCIIIAVFSALITFGAASPVIKDFIPIISPKVTITLTNSGEISELGVPGTTYFTGVGLDGMEPYKFYNTPLVDSQDQINVDGFEFITAEDIGFFLDVYHSVKPKGELSFTVKKARDMWIQILFSPDSSKAFLTYENVTQELQFYSPIQKFELFYPFKDDPSIAYFHIGVYVFIFLLICLLLGGVYALVAFCNKKTLTRNNPINNRHLFSSENILFLILSLFFVTSIIPLFYLDTMFYPVTDDFVCSMNARHAYEATGSYFAAIKGAAESTVNMYYHWMGSYTTSFVNSLGGHVISLKFFKLQAAFMQGIFFFSIIFMLYVLNKNYLQMSRRRFMMIGLFLLTVIINLAPIHSAREALYWYSGLSAYTVPLTLTIFWYAITIYRPEKKVSECLRLISIPFLAILVAGCHIAVAPVAIFGFLALLIFNRPYTKNQRFYFGGVFLLSLVCLAINVIAPGNSNRQTYFERSSLVESVVTSVMESLKFIKTYNFSTILLPITIIILPLIYLVCKKSTMEFKHPVLFLSATFSVYAAAFFPMIYSTGMLVAESALRTIYFLYNCMVWFWFLNIFYLVGWLTPKIEPFIAKHAQILKTSCIVTAALTISFLTMSVLKTPNSWISYATVIDLHNGVGERYQEEMELNFSLLENPNVKEPIATYHFPAPLPMHNFHLALMHDPGPVENTRMFYEKDNLTAVFD